MMKKAIITIAGVLILLFVYLIIKANINDGWSRFDRVLFGAGLFLAVINSLAKIYYDRALKRENK